MANISPEKTEDLKKLIQKNTEKTLKMMVSIISFIKANLTDMLKHVNSSSLQLSQVTFDNKYYEIITEYDILKTSMYVSSFVYEIFCRRSNNKPRTELKESINVLNTCGSNLYENVEILRQMTKCESSALDANVDEMRKDCTMLMLSSFPYWKSFLSDTMFEDIHSKLTKTYFLQFYNLVTSDFC